MPALTPRIAVLCQAPGRYPAALVDDYLTLEELLLAPSYDVLLLDLPSIQAGQALRRLRAVEAYHYTLVYCCQELDPWCAALGDGKVPELPAITPLWRLWRERLALFNNGLPAQRFETRVLTWLWLHSHTGIQALRDSAAPQLYRYPLLEALAGTETINAFTWLQLATQQGWLDEGELLDRLRLCTGCGSGRINYVDVCPECHVLDIARQPSLHCFACGHIGPQEQYLKDGLLLCPNCLSRLRHIGSDYDRPLENYRCRGCQAFFIDAAVEARCLDCNQVHSPERLRVREVRHFQLSEVGRLRCRQGFEGELAGASHFERLGLVGLQTFTGLLDWQMQLTRRYGEPGFSLLGLHFVNLSETFAELGEMRTHAVLDGLVERLQEAIRDTDRCSRSSEELLWLLLPHTHAQGLTLLQERLLNGSKLLQEGDATKLELRVVGFTAPGDLEAQETAELLLARLAGQLE